MSLHAQKNALPMPSVGLVERGRAWSSANEKSATRLSERMLKDLSHLQDLLVSPNTEEVALRWLFLSQEVGYLCMRLQIYLESVGATLSEDSPYDLDQIERFSLVGRQLYGPSFSSVAVEIDRYLDRLPGYQRPSIRGVGPIDTIALEKHAYIVMAITRTVTGRQSDLSPPPATNEPTYPDAVSRAFQIADEAMFEWLQAYGALGHGDPARIGLTGAGGGPEVSCLAEAGNELRDAFEWLQPRGYVELAKDERGEFIRVLHEPETMYDDARVQVQPAQERGHA